jgi:L-amino acid N-acyltransferase YncA
MDIKYEPLNDGHRRPVIDILNYYIVNSFASYLDRKVSYEFYDIFLSMMKGYPATAVVSNAEVIGFCFLRAHNPIPAFRRAAEITYFLRHDMTRRGHGAGALGMLAREAGSRGIDTLLASVSSLNKPSLAFHLKHGFAECGRFQRVGRKFERDFDVVWMQKFI